MITMGLISYSGLYRLGLGLRFQSTARRWGWNRFCHTNISDRPMESTAMQFNPETDVKSTLDDGDEAAEDEGIYQGFRGWMKPPGNLWSQIIPSKLDEERYNVKSNLDLLVKFSKKEILASDLMRVLSRLHKDGRFSLALKIFGWMGEKDIYEFSPRDHAFQINLIGKVRGLTAAERYLWNLPEQARNDVTYGELLHCYVDKHRTEKALFHFQKMKELGFLSSPRPFNEIMRLYANSLQIEKVLEVLAELKKSKVSPDNDSYRICISSYGLNYDVDGMERMLREMESQPHIVMDWCTYAVVAEFYEREVFVDKATDALKKADVILQKKNNTKNNEGSYNLINSDYENVIKSLVKLGELDKAMRFAKEWELLSNWRTVDDISIPYTIIEEYIKNGSLQEASYRFICEWVRKGRAGVDRLSRLLCNEFLKVGDLFYAYSRFQATFGNMLGPLVVQRSFAQYLEEECGSFFPIRSRGSLCCTGSFKTAGGKTFFELIPMNVEYKLTAAVLVHPENSTQAAVVNTDYENIIKSLVESGELNEARKTAMEWEASGNLTSLDGLNISKLIIDGYCRKNCFVEAEGMAEAWTRERKSWVRGVWLMLACHYQEEGKLVRGLECLRRFFSLTPWLKRHVCHFMFEMYLYMVEYSRGMNAAGLSDHRMRAYNLFELNEILCWTEDGGFK